MLLRTAREADAQIREIVDWFDVIGPHLKSVASTGNGATQPDGVMRGFLFVRGAYDVQLDLGRLARSFAFVRLALPQFADRCRRFPIRLVQCSIYRDR